MSSRNDGGPAFPTPRYVNVDGETHSLPPDESGMSLRDWFAGQALAGLLASMAHPQSMSPQDYPLENHASGAFKLADALLAERERRS